MTLDAKINFNIKVDRKLKDKFVELARINEKTASVLMRNYMKNYILQITLSK